VVVTGETELERFVERAGADLAAAISGVLVYVGDRLGLYRAMAAAGPLSPGALAAATGTDERHVREWLDNQAAGGYVEYDPAAGTYRLPPAQAGALADEDHPAFLAGGYASVAAAYVDADAVVDAFRSGRGIAWRDRDARLALGGERLRRPAYRAWLRSAWLPALDGVEARLRGGGRVADVGCGHGAATILMADAFPRSVFVGFDSHAPAIATARERAGDAGLAGDRVQFVVASAKDYPGDDYDLVTFFDCLHDFGDPVGAAVHARRALADHGAVMVVEPYAHDRPERNHHALGRASYAFSTVACTMTSRAQEVGLALGAQAGEARLREVFEQAGFGSFRRAAETQAHLVFEARP
jgi:SAM-dependent methyltransferase